GFQILTEIGLLPGALLNNDSHLFVSRNESLKITNNKTMYTNLYDEDEIVVYPVAHGEGHYYCTPEMYEALEANNQIILKYQDNPNGSYNDIAGLINEKGKDRKSTRLNSSHVSISYAVFCLKKN